MALRRSVMTDDILCELYVDTFLMSDNCEAEIFDHDSVIPTTSPRKNFDLSLSFSSESGKYSKRKK